MPTLKEIKGRISSVRNTLKITSAMKLVSSAKLRKAQNAIQAMRPYQQALQGILNRLSPDGAIAVEAPSKHSDQRVIIALASNSSLCGGFNGNAIAKVKEVREDSDVVYSIGKKMADAMAKEGYVSPKDYSALSEKPEYGPAAALVESLSKDYQEGKVGQVLVVYNHFVSTGRQVPVVEQLLPMGKVSAQTDEEDTIDAEDDANAFDAIIEPNPKELLETLLPKTLKLKLFAALLDSAAAEHAARVVAMQTATDNAQDLLTELTLQYNKGRQQKITSEILDLAGGQAQE